MDKTVTVRQRDAAVRMGTTAAGGSGLRMLPRGASTVMCRNTPWFNGIERSLEKMKCIIFSVSHGCLFPAVGIL